SRLKRVVAIKVLPESRLHDPRALARFYQEMEAVGRFDNPHIVRALDANEADGHHFLVMEYIAGLDLSHLLARCGPFSVADACEAARQTAVGLQYVYEHGLVHRDIKPSNLLLTPAGQVKILDLGLARLHEEDPSDPRLTDTGEVMGTPDYIAPEQAFDAHHVDIRADLYSLGCTLYTLLAGCPPFSGPEYDSRMKKMLAHVQTPIPPLRDRRPEVPAAVAAVVDRLLAKTPAGRPATPGEVVRELERFTQGANLARLLASVAGNDPGGMVLELNSGSGPDPLAATRTMGIQKPASSPAASPVGPTPPMQLSRRIPRWWLALLAVALLALGSLVAVVVWLQGPPSASSGNSKQVPEQTQAPAQVPPHPTEGPVPGHWYNLLTHPPTLLLWPDPPGDSDWRWSNDQQRLIVSSTHTALFSLGEAPPENYTLQVGIRQLQWAGGVGVFFGYHEEQVQGQVRHQCQFIHLRPFLPQDPDRAFNLCRGTLELRTQNGQIHTSTDTLALRPVRQPPPREQILELTIERGGLTGLRWDGQNLTELTRPDINGKFTPADYQGPFGTLNESSEAIFHASLLLTGERHDEPR
ncbi:MAG: serine/threonine protein kinase, partial [Planctomycetes bacterium]|nr:serine/threonine protein kinase [Planctomycetota bacterium]